MLEEVQKGRVIPRKIWSIFGFKLPFSWSTIGLPNPVIGLVVDGRALNTIFQGKLEHKFLQLAKYSHSVLCCRCTPLQKSMVVKLVRNQLKVLTLAVGKHHVPSSHCHSLRSYIFSRILCLQPCLSFHIVYPFGCLGKI